MKLSYLFKFCANKFLLAALSILLSSSNQSIADSAINHCGKNNVDNPDLIALYDKENYLGFYEYLLPCALVGHEQSLGWIASILISEKFDTRIGDRAKRERIILDIATHLASEGDELGMKLLGAIYKSGSASIVEKNKTIGQCWSDLSENLSAFNDCLSMSSELQNIEYNKSNGWGLK